MAVRFSPQILSCARAYLEGLWETDWARFYQADEISLASLKADSKLPVRADHEFVNRKKPKSWLVRTRIVDERKRPASSSNRHKFTEVTTKMRLREFLLINNVQIAR